MRHEQICHGIDDVSRIESAFDVDHERLLRELINDVERAKHAAIMGQILNEVMRCRHGCMFRPQPDAGSVVQPEPALFRLFLWDFECRRGNAPPGPFLILLHPAARSARCACDLLASRCCSASRRSCGIHSVRIVASAG